MIFPETLLVLAGALLLDRLLGDPPWLWSRIRHPAVWGGALVTALDRRLNLDFDPDHVRRRQGVLAAVLLVSLGLAAGFLLAVLLKAFPFGALAEMVIVAILLAQKSLLDHIRAVADALDLGLEQGRRAVAMVVGRDVEVLDQAGVARAAVESLAENFSDGVIAPAFWYALAGLPGILVYKLVNTADSMIGHRSRRYREFGWASARLDDLLNLVPARLSALLLVVAAPLVGRNPWRSGRVALRDAPSHRSPNAGWPEAAAAGALNLALGGPRR
jgi:adenosylcobinamide-phosphate synthase